MADPNDPTVAAYLSAIGFDDAAARAAADKRKADINANAGRLLGIPGVDQGEIAYQGGLSREGITNDVLGRGVYSSGEHDLALAHQAHAQDYQRSGALLSQTQGLGDVDLELARQLAANEASRATLLATPDQPADAGGVQVILNPAGLGGYGDTSNLRTRNPLVPIGF